MSRLLLLACVASFWLQSCDTVPYEEDKIINDVYRNLTTKAWQVVGLQCDSTQVNYSPQTFSFENGGQGMFSTALSSADYFWEVYTYGPPNYAKLSIYFYNSSIAFEFDVIEYTDTYMKWVENREDGFCVFEVEAVD